ncbi:MAG: RNA polymerase sigma factor [Ferruginibacter sp.]
MEESYIRNIIKGDISQYSYFIEKYKDMAYTIASRITRNNEDAEEVVQDSFLKAYNGLSKFKANASFSTWFYKIVVNTSLTKAKRKLSFAAYVELDEINNVEDENINTAFATLAKAEQKKMIYEVLAEMEIEDNLLLTLYYLNESSIEEIFEITAIPVQNIKMKLHRARKKMYRIFEGKLNKEMQCLL